MRSDSPPRKTNDPIFLEDISITHIAGQRLAEPCAASVVLHLSPKIMCRIESDNLPKSLVNLQHDAFLITTQNGCKAKVFLRYNPNDLMSLRESLRGFLVPYKSPCTVIHSDIRLRSVSFGVLNFPRFYGRKDKWIDMNEMRRRLGVAEMKDDGLMIEITEDPSLSENTKSLQTDDGYAVTHTGLIRRYDGENFCVKEAENILRRLRAFLSFARGSACGVTLVKAVDQNGSEMILEWGTTHTEPWSKGNDTWMPTKDGGDTLSPLFPGFWKLCNDQDWRETLFDTIDWYLNSKNGPFHVGIILAEAALESLCYKITSAKGKGVAGRDVPKALRKVGLCTKIPPSCRELKRFSEEHSQFSDEGPKAIADVRNDLVHANKKFSYISAEAQMDALRLAQWYIELILLKQFDYHGRYRNRLTIVGENPFTNVPWANGNLETSATK